RLHPMIRQAWGLRDGRPWQGEVVSEIGHFGVLFASADRLHLNRGAGYLVRTKRHDVDEGGISAGFGHLDALARVEG
ncbi:MAG: glutathione synthase, partial [Candidatus Competibacteraceae bacterium]|nr:glutathione synthase [Candidatus Competibacteraceae bacterium]